MIRPLDLRQLEERELFVAWEDGHRSLYPYHELRLHCPCAGCVDETSGRRTLTPEKVKTDIQLLKIEPVGRYALRFGWSDNHQTGIYSFDYLRSLCRCAACQKTKSEENPSPRSSS